MKVDDQMVSSGNADFFKPNFRYTLESLVPYLISLPSTRSISVDPHDAVVYNQDLYGYLLSVGILQCYHWITMRINGYFSPTEFDTNAAIILIPSSNELESIRQSWNASTVIKT